MKRFNFAAFCLTALVAASGALRLAPAGAAEPAPRGAQAVLDQASRDQKYTFLIFYKDETPMTRAMGQLVAEGVAKRQDQATSAHVRLSDPVERTLVDHYGATRAPTPLLVAVAPNGAITGVFPHRATDKQMADSFVAAPLANCLKLMQEEKLVFVCIHSEAEPATPPAVAAFQADPEFQKRVGVLPLAADEPGAAELLKRYDVDAAQLNGQLTLFLAPPGVVVGKFPFDAPKEQVLAALHKAGKCCNDPNCHHGRQAQQSGASKR